MVDMSGIPHFENADQFLFFEPRPDNEFHDNTLEGCLAYASKVEKLSDKNNLYLCEKCTEDRYGKSKFLTSFC
jgi:hypothetical protein